MVSLLDRKRNVNFSHVEWVIRGHQRDLPFVRALRDCILYIDGNDTQCRFVDHVCLLFFTQFVFRETDSPSSFRTHYVVSCVSLEQSIKLVPTALHAIGFQGMLPRTLFKEIGYGRFVVF